MASLEFAVRQRLEKASVISTEPRSVAAYLFQPVARQWDETRIRLAVLGDDDFLASVGAVQEDATDGSWLRER
jgi:hypothetical protein